LRGDSRGEDADKISWQVGALLTSIFINGVTGGSWFKDCRSIRTCSLTTSSASRSSFSAVYLVVLGGLFATGSFATIVTVSLVFAGQRTPAPSISRLGWLCSRI